MNGNQIQTIDELLRHGCPQPFADEPKYSAHPHKRGALPEWEQQDALKYQRTFYADADYERKHRYIWNCVHQIAMNTEVLRKYNFDSNYDILRIHFIQRPEGDIVTTIYEIFIQEELEGDEKLVGRRQLITGNSPGERTDMLDEMYDVLHHIVTVRPAVFSTYIDQVVLGP